jgi:hypothetical protein
LLGKAILLRGKPSLKAMREWTGEVIDFHKTYIGAKIPNSIVTTLF